MHQTTLSPSFLTWATNFWARPRTFTFKVMKSWRRFLEELFQKFYFLLLKQMRRVSTSPCSMVTCRCIACTRELCLQLKWWNFFHFLSKIFSKYLFTKKNVDSRQRLISNRHFQARRCADLAQVGKWSEQDNPRWKSSRSSSGRRRCLPGFGICCWRRRRRVPGYWFTSLPGFK